MLKIKDGRICIGGASIALPNGLYLTNIYSKPQNIIFTDKENTFFLELGIRKKDENIIRSIKDSAALVTCSLSQEIKEIAFNGLEGFYGLYCSHYYNFYEARLYSATAASDECLFVLITAFANRTNIKKVLDKPEIKSFFCDIRTE